MEDAHGGDAATWRAAGIYDPDAPTAADRLAVLEYLSERGATLEELEEGHRQGRLPALAGTLARRSGRTLLTPAELEAAGVVDREQLRHIWEAAGLAAPVPDARELTDQDAEALAAFVAGIDVFGQDPLLQFTRVVGAAVASIADASMAVFGLTVAGRCSTRARARSRRRARSKTGRASSSTWCRRSWARCSSSTSTARVDRYVAGGGDDVGAQVAYLAVGFVDLVESTPMIQTLPAEEIAAAISGFEQRATTVVAARQGRVVKTIGDEVMFVANTAADAAEIALAFVDYAAAHPALRGVRGGLAWGPLVRGYADFYGPVVNLAARAVKEAQPGEVLAEVELVGQVQAATSLRVGTPREYALRGFAEPVVLWPIDRPGS